MYIRMKFMEREPVKYCLYSVKGRGGRYPSGGKNANSFFDGLPKKWLKMTGLPPDAALSRLDAFAGPPAQVLIIWTMLRVPDNSNF